MGGEDVDYPVDGLRRALGMQGRQHQVTGLSSGNGRGDCLMVPHLTNQDHVGVFTKGRPEAPRKGGHIGTYLPLVYQAGPMGMEVLNGVLQCHYVEGLLLVHKVNHGRQRRGFAAPGRAGNKDQALLLSGQVRHGLGHPEFIQA